MGPGRQPSITVIRPASASKTRPVTPSLAAEPSHTTSGDTFSGAIASNSPSPGAAIVSANVCSVIRVRAAGAIALTWTPYRPISAAATSVRPTMPAFAAE